MVTNPTYVKGKVASPVALIDTDTGLPVSIDSNQYLEVSIKSSAGLTVTAGSEYAEDAAHTTADTGNFVLSVRTDTASARGGTDGDYQPLITDANGRLHVLDQNSAAILADTAALVVDAAASEVLLTTIAGDTTSLDGKDFATQTTLAAVLADTAAIQTAVEGTLTVSGTVTANLSATDNAVLDTIDAVLDTINAKLVTGTTIGVVELSATDNAVLDAIEATANAIQTAVEGTLTVGSHAVTNAGTFAVQEDGAALTALQVIDNPVFADDAAFTLASSSVMVAGAIRDDSLSTLTAIEGDAVPFRVSSTGALHVTGGGGGTEYTEDVATANPIVGTATMMERDDALSTVTPIEGDWIGLRGSAEGALWVQDFNSDAILADTTAILADTANMDTNLGTVAGAVTGTEMQVDIVANATDFATQTTLASVLTAVQLIDNPVAVLGTATYTEATSSGMIVGVVRNDTLATLANTDNEVAPLQVDPDGALYSTHGVTDLADGVTTVTTAGTDVVLASSTACKMVIIQAQTDNTGIIAVGNTGVDATVATGTGVALAAGESITIPADNLADIYIDSTVNGEGVRYTYFT